MTDKLKPSEKRRMREMKVSQQNEQRRLEGLVAKFGLDSFVGSHYQKQLEIVRLEQQVVKLGPNSLAGKQSQQKLDDLKASS